jgi:hypothetical protein
VRSRPESNNLFQVFKVAVFIIGIDGKATNDGLDGGSTGHGGGYEA